MTRPAEREHARLVLVGGGHAHVQVLRNWLLRPVYGVDLTLVVDRPTAVYSGMVPGWVAGDYAREDLEIDVRSLAERAGSNVRLAAAVRVDPEKRCIEVEGGAPVSYDVASLDVGSGVRGLDLPGVAEYALPTRPISTFIPRLKEALESPPRGAWALRVAVVGGGIAGIELALTLEARLRSEGRAVEVTVLADPAILPESPHLARALRKVARERGIRLREPFRALHIDASAVHGEGERCVYDLAVWATGAAPPSLIEASELPKDSSGFVRVRPTLQVVGHASLFAVGDCAALEYAPWVRKAGVYAVRMGPVLDRNLRAQVRAARGSRSVSDARPAPAPGLRSYRPQRAFLALVNLGGGRALGTKWGLRARGRWVWKLKDLIDRRFVRRFR